MGLDVSRWLKYAKARVDAAFASGHEELDEMEAERNAILAEKPWLGADDETPTLDQARARIEWEARRQAGGPDPTEDEPGTGKDGPRGRGTDSDGRGSDRDGSDGSAARGSRPTPTDPGGSGTDDPGGSPSGALPGSPSAADAAAAKIELEDKRRRTAERLDQIRRELGVDDLDGA